MITNAHLDHDQGSESIEPHIDLTAFDNSWYSPGRSKFTQALWFFFGSPLLRSSLLPGSAFRRFLLRIFGGRIGDGVVIKPGVKVKYPWRLVVGKHSWLGEDCWIDNLAHVTIGSHVCVSQGAFLCTGNHDWTDPSFSLIVKPITAADGAWIGAKAVITPGVLIGNCAMVAVGAVATKNVPDFEIHSGNPAQFVKKRETTRQPKSEQNAGD